MTVPDFDERARELINDWFPDCTHGATCEDCEPGWSKEVMVRDFSTALAAVWNEAIGEAAKVFDNAAPKVSSDAAVMLIRALLAGKGES